MLVYPKVHVLDPTYSSLINDLPLAVQKANVSMSTDDRSLCHQSHYITQLNEVVNSAHIKKCNENTCPAYFHQT